MAATVDGAAARWLAQLAEMRKAIADLNLTHGNGSSTTNGIDESADDSEDLSPVEDVWDLISEVDDNDFSDDSVAEATTLSYRNGVQSSQPGSRERSCRALSTC